MPPSYKKQIKPANLHTYALPGTKDSIGVEAAVDARAYAMYQSALTQAHGDRDLAIRLLQAAQTLALIGDTDEQVLKHLEEMALQAAQASLLNRAGVTAEEFATDTKGSCDKLADLLLGGLAAGAGSKSTAN